MDSVESSITTLNTKSTTLGVTLQTICDRIDNSYDEIQDDSEKYSCCFNPDNQLMICATQTFIDLGAIAITPGAAGDQCLATDLACQWMTRIFCIWYLLNIVSKVNLLLQLVYVLCVNILIGYIFILFLQCVVR